MEQFRFKLLPLVLVYFFSFSPQINCEGGETIPTFSANQIKSTTTAGKNFTVQNIFNQKSNIKTGDVVQCEVTKTKALESHYNDVHVFTQVGNHLSAYVFYPVSKNTKCFSFEVRASKFPCIMFTPTPRGVQGQRLEVIFDYHGNSVIRTKDGKHVSSAPTPGIVNDRELRRFWIRWLDDQLLEVGRDTDIYPLLSYRLPEKLNVNFIGLLSYTVEAEWILHGEPKCGHYNATEKYIQAETKCVVLGSGNLEKNNVLQKSQQHILNQIKTQHEIFKVSKFRSKEIILEYQQTIRQLYKNAQENQNQIYAGDNEVYCPLKAAVFNEITKEYYQFLEALQQELSFLKESDDSLISLRSDITK